MDAKRETLCHYFKYSTSMASHKKYENVKINNEINDVIKFELDLGGWKVSSF